MKDTPAHLVNVFLALVKKEEACPMAPSVASATVAKGVASVSVMDWGCGRASVPTPPSATTSIATTTTTITK